MSDCLKKGNHIGLFLALIFVLAYLMYWVHPVQQELRVDVLQALFFGFEGMDGLSFILGLIQSYIWGYIFCFLWCLAGFSCCGSCCKR